MYKPLSRGFAEVKGWVVTRGQVDVVQQNGDQWKGPHGGRQLDLHGSPGLGGADIHLVDRLDCWQIQGAFPLPPTGIETGGD